MADYSEQILRLMEYIECGQSIARDMDAGLLVDPEGTAMWQDLRAQYEENIPRFQRMLQKYEDLQRERFLAKHLF